MNGRNRRRSGSRQLRWQRRAGILFMRSFYEKLNGLLDQRKFDGFAEETCRRFYSKTGRPGLAPGVYFRLLLVGYFEGIDSERGGVAPLS